MGFEKNMNGKIIFGSIATASIIILASFTSVIAYQSEKTNVKMAKSPLFKLRVNRLKDHTTVDRTTYVGMNKKPTVSLPILEGDLLGKFIEKIKNPNLLRVIQQKYPLILSKLRKVDINLLIKEISTGQLEKIKNFLESQKLLTPNKPPWYTIYALPSPILCIIITIITILLYPFIWFLETCLSHCFLP